MSTLESWVHLHPNVLNFGRVSHYANPNLGDEVLIIFIFNKF